MNLPKHKHENESVAAGSSAAGGIIPRIKQILFITNLIYNKSYYENPKVKTE
ncbi:MAG: hypothetical protein ACI4SA_06855 [Lachnospiraceae bacterium]